MLGMQKGVRLYLSITVYSASHDVYIGRINVPAMALAESLLFTLSRL